MIFKDVLLVGGAVEDQRFIDTGAIDEELYLSCARLLARLRVGLLRAETEVQGHKLAVSFRQPSFAESIADRIESTGRSFTVCAEDANVFVFSLLLDVDVNPKDEFDCFTMLTLSEATATSKPNKPISDRVQSLISLRPCLIHAVISIENSDHSAVPIIRDCSTQLGAAILSGY